MKTLITKPTLFILLLSCVLAVSSCKKDEPSDIAPIGNTGNGSVGNLSAYSYLSGNLIEADFMGMIRDENGQVISGVEVRMGNSTTYTDSDGIWQLLDVMVDSKRAYIRAEKEGYFHGSRVLAPSLNGFNRAFITLMTAQSAGTVSSSDGGEVTHSSGSMVSLPADGYVDENGNAYSGMVEVQICYLDPSSQDIFEQMPGNLSALDSDDDFVALKTYGMMGVELLGSGGESLQIAPGAAAEIHLPVPAVGMATAPSSIPLWNFDEEEGVWKEDGSAQLVGNEYVGTVSHFSFWNCDVPNDYIFLDGYVFGAEGAYPIQGVQITLVTNGLGSASAYSDAEGYFGGMVPAGEVFTMEVYSPCGDLLFTQEIGPFNSDVTVPVIAIFEEDFGIITGTMMDCGGEPVQGFISVTNYGYLPETVEVSEDGSFVMAYGCPPQDVQLIGYSPDYTTNSGIIDVTTIPGESVDVGIVDLCAVLTEEYLVFTVNGETYTMVDSLFAYSNSGNLYIAGSQFSNAEYSDIGFSLEDTPAPPSASFDSESNYFYAGQLVSGNLIEPSDMVWDFTSYSTTVGDYLEFTFTGTYDVYVNGVLLAGETMSGYGRVQRD